VDPTPSVDPGKTGGFPPEDYIYLDEIKSICTRYVNMKCQDIEILKDRLPINPESEELFAAMSDGMILIHLLNMIESDTIYMRMVHTDPNPSIDQIKENIDTALNGCKGHIKTLGVTQSSFLEKVPKYILSVLIQIIQILAFSSLTLKENAELILLKN
jgi:hypothetical protein